MVSMGGDGKTKGQAGAGCFGNPRITVSKGSVWVDPNANAEDPNNAVQKSNCGDGKSAATAGLTCKSIKIKTGTKANQHFWVIGRNQEFMKSPKEVFCWQSSRDGGGWTLVLRSYYAGHHRPSYNGNGVTTTGNVKSDPLQRLGGIYKMHDHEIRAYIGQSEHTNDAANGPTSTFEYMMDQSNHNGYYSGGNYEWVLVKNYNARWRFHRFQHMAQSKSQVDMTVFDWNSNFNGRNDQGEGRVNWSGEPCCGKGACTNPSGAGISCRGSKTGSPNRSPYGGRGCHRNRGYDRWHGDLHVYMCNTNHDTYFYLCNGAHHSSSNRFAHRTWMRTDSNDQLG